MGNEGTSKTRPSGPEPEWDRWRRRELWRIDDAVCLMLAIDPLGVMGRWIKERWHRTEERLEVLMQNSAVPDDYLPEELRPVVRAAIDMRDCAEASRRAHSLTLSFPDDEARGLVAPEALFQWARSRGYQIPPQLAEAAGTTSDKALPLISDFIPYAGGITWVDALHDKRLRSVLAEQTGGSDTSASGETKRLATLQKLVLAMAKAKYGWLPDGKRNPATGTKAGSIYADVAEQLGESIDPDTIRDVLNQADKDFPGHE